MITTDKVKRLKFNENWVDIRESISYQEVQDMQKSNKDVDEEEASLNQMMFFIKAWSLDLPINKDNLKKLEIKVYNKIISEIVDIIIDDKKKDIVD